jgi:hypothetical protein
MRVGRGHDRYGGRPAAATPERRKPDKLPKPVGAFLASITLWVEVDQVPYLALERLGQRERLAVLVQQRKVRRLVPLLEHADDATGTS